MKKIWLLFTLTTILCGLVRGDRMCTEQSNNDGLKMEYVDSNELNLQNKGVIITKHELQQQRTECLPQKQQKPTTIELLLPDYRKEEEMKKETAQRLKRSNIFNPFDFSNLKRLQQKQRIDNINNNNYNDYNNEKHQQQWHIQTFPFTRHYKDNEGNKNGRTYYSFKNSNNVKENNNNSDEDDTNTKLSNGNTKNGDYWLQTLAAATESAKSPKQQDANNDFRLQLSDINEPVRDNNNNKIQRRNYNNDRSVSIAAINKNINTNNNDGIDNHRYSGIDTGRIHSSAIYDAGIDATKSLKNHNNINSIERSEHDDAINTTSNSRVNTDDMYIGKTHDRQSAFNNIYHYAGDNFIDKNDDESYNEELDTNLPYGIQNVRKRVQHQNFEIQERSMSTTYQSLCPTKRQTIVLETAEHEYRPNQFIEVTCAHDYLATQNFNHKDKNKICSEAGFSCIQLNRTIHLIRRNKASTIECWESEVRIIPSGCECMWPKHRNGDIITYHNTQKRFNAAANIRPEADYVPGVGYQQFPRQIELLSLDGSRREEPNDGTGFETYTLN